MLHEQLYNNTFPEQGAINNPKEFLQDVVNEYPYFSVAHFFLLKETANTDINYRKIAAKTAMHFNNPFLLKYQLNRKSKEVNQLKAVENIPIPMEKEPGLVIEQQDVQEITQEMPEMQDVQNTGEIKQPAGITDLSDTEKTELARAIANNESPENKKIEPLNETATDAAIPANPDKKEELLFEPLYTTDYFASQGIKLSEEVQSGDKLGKQLKSFTDWLKTMKKLHHGKLPEGTNIDQVVQNMAEKSNKEQEVLTEAMAEVYVQQGKIEKAGEIYRKLSLLNPSKSAYFAAKIELLKEN